MTIKIPKPCSMFWSWHIYWAYTGWYYLYPVNLVNQKMHLAWWLMKFYFGGKQVGISINGDTPIAAWFISWKIPSIHGWFGGTTILGNLQVVYTMDGSMVYCESLSNQQKIPVALRIEAERRYPWDLSWLKPKVNIYIYICDIIVYLSNISIHIYIYIYAVHCI